MKACLIRGSRRGKGQSSRTPLADPHFLRSSGAAAIDLDQSPPRESVHHVTAVARSKGPLWVRNAPNGFGCQPPKVPTSAWAGRAKRRPSAPSIGSCRQRAEKHLCFRHLRKFRARRKALERRCEQGMSVCGTAGGIVKSCQIESCAQLKTARLLDGDCGE